MKKIISTIGIISTIFTGLNAGHYYVSKNGDNTNGSSWATAYNKIQDAMSQASAGDSIFVSKGTFYPHLSDKTVPFQIKQGVKLLGGFSGSENPITSSVIENRNFKSNETILSGDINKDGLKDGNSYNVVLFRNKDNSTLLDGFSIRHGNADGPGSFADGGGVRVEDNSNPVLKNLIIDSCNADYGGAMSFDTNSYSNIENIIIKDNTAYYGGGISTESAYPTIKNGLFYNNRASEFGGALYNRNMGFASSGPTYINCTFNNNNAGSTSFNSGGVIHHFSSGSAPAPEIINSILWDNTNSYQFGTSSDNDEVSNDVSTTKIEFSYCIIENAITYTGWNEDVGVNVSNNYDENPEYVNPGQNNYDLFTSSPAIANGNPTYGDNIGYYQGSGIIKPNLTINGTISWGYVEEDSVSSEKTFTVEGANLISDVYVAGLPNFEVSLTSGSGFTNDTLTLTPSGANLSETTIYVRFTPDTTGIFQDNIQIFTTQDSESIIATGTGKGDPVIEAVDNFETCWGATVPQIEITIDDEAFNTVSLEAISTKDDFIPNSSLITGGSGKKQDS